MVRKLEDALGEVELPRDALWGCTTARAKSNFQISTQARVQSGDQSSLTNDTMPWEIIEALIKIKRAGAKVNCDLDLLSKEKRDAIIWAADEVLTGKYCDQFPLPVWQTGSGTATNMNVNEVLATLGVKYLQDNADKKDLSEKDAKNSAKNTIHPNDDVNKGQSSNDTFSSALHIATYTLYTNEFQRVVVDLIEQFDKLASKYQDVIKVGRTHMMDATPLRLRFEVFAWKDAVAQGYLRLDDAASRLQFLALGGTAVGSGINTHDKFGEQVCEVLGFKRDPNSYYQISFKDTIAHFSSSLKDFAMTLYKIASDIRLYASGPRAGIGEFQIPANEPGSSIMPGKVNPTQIEALTQVCIQVYGNDAAVGFASSQGQFQLNTYMPLIGYNVLQSLHLLGDTIKSFNVHLLQGLEPNLPTINHNLDNSLMLVTKLAPVIGYDKASKIAKTALEQNLTLLEVALAETDLSKLRLQELLNPEQMV